MEAARMLPSELSDAELARAAAPRAEAVWLLVKRRREDSASGVREEEKREAGEATRGVPVKGGHAMNGAHK